MYSELRIRNELADSGLGKAEKKREIFRCYVYHQSTQFMQRIF
jgi:hypothetical protein